MPADLSKELQELLYTNFDHKFYLEEYYDLKKGSRQELFSHFLLTGIHEGRSPNPFFDVSEYLSSYKDVLRSGMNPIVHYHLHGKNEGRQISQTIRIIPRLMLLEEETEIDWINLIGASLDAEYYQKQLSLLFPQLLKKDINYAVHYGLIGWKLGLDPSPDFSTHEWQIAHPDLLILKLSPLLLHNVAAIVQVETAESAAAAQTEAIATAQAAAHALAINEGAMNPGDMEDFSIGDSDQFTNVFPEYDTYSPPEHKENAHPKNEIVSDKNEGASLYIASSLFDPSYYLAKYTDVKLAGVDPLYHYVNAGWREGRNPSANFSTSFYLSTYKEVAEAATDPLTHYFLKGRAKGYMTKPAGGWKIEVFEQSSSPSIRELSYQPYKSIAITANELRREIFGKNASQKTKNKFQLILAVSHDSYSTVTGGTQIFIADEMTNSLKKNIVHLHMAPSTPGLTIGKKEKQTEVLITKNGKALGSIDSKSVFEMLSTVPSDKMHISIHSLIGFGSEFLALLKPITKNRKTFFWLHDYSILCDGFNLLRNDTVFCGAPEPKSVACTVCIYGEERSKRLALIKSWLTEVKPIFASPSEAALSILNCSKTRLPITQSIVVPHWTLTRASIKKREPRSPLRIAFVGFSSASKGWPIFNEIVNTLSENAATQFYHFIKGGTSPNSLVKAVDCAVTSKNRLATSTLLKKHKIDIVMILSPWPETFSYVTAESLVAGCAIVCLASSGNVQALVKSYQQGIVFNSDEALMQSIKDATFIPKLRKALRTNHLHTMKQNRGIFDALTQSARAG